VYPWAFSSTFDQALNDRRIRKGGGVAEARDIVLGDLPQDTPHDPSGTCLWQAGSELNDIRQSDGDDLLANPLLEFGLYGVGWRAGPPRRFSKG